MLIQKKLHLELFVFFIFFQPAPTTYKPNDFALLDPTYEKQANSML